MKGPMCEKVELFSDGALSPEESAEFREHLGTCEDCRRELMDLAQLHVLQTRLKNSNVISITRHPRWKWSVPAISAALAALLAVTIWTGFQRYVPDDVYYPYKTVRANGGMSSYQNASLYLPLEEKSLGGESVATPSADILARFDRKNDQRGAAAYLLAFGGTSRSEEALKRLEQLPSTPEVLSERAYAYLVHDNREQRDLEEALRLADAALAARPGFTPALWNRAVALRELGLTLAAARAFDAVAQQGKPGWSAEAMAQAQTIRDEGKRSRQNWSDATEAGYTLAETGVLPGGLAFLDAPVTRYMFYEAVKGGSTTPEKARAFLPDAKRLDALAGDTTLTRYVEAVAKRPFGRRGPLAEEYRRMVAGAKDVNLEHLLRGTLDAGEPDMVLGVLGWLARAKSPSAELSSAELKRLVAATGGDPWHQAWARKLLAGALQREGEGEASRLVLEQAVKDCDQATHMEFRCLDLRVDLTYAYERTLRLADGVKVALDGWKRAVEVNEWNRQQQFILHLANMTRIREDAPLAQAYYEEALERFESAKKAGPEFERYAHEGLAVLDVDQLRFEEARKHVDAALATKIHLGLPGALALTGLPGTKPSDADAMKDFFDLPSGPRFGAGEKALAQAVRGRWALERTSNREEGEKVLREAIQLASADGLALRDPDARRALSYAYTTLILDAGRRGKAEEALRLFEEEWPGALPQRCLMAVTADGPRTLAVVRPAGGPARIAYRDEARTKPVLGRAGDLLPQAAKHLPGCEAVSVLARAPVYGHADLLPSDVAWSYLGGAASGPQGSPVSGGGHVVVQQATAQELPAWVREKLTTPQRWEVKEPGVKELTGDRATPSEVFRWIENASEITFVAHAVTNPDSNESVLLLAPDKDHRSTITASDITQHTLRGRPLVFLASCKGALPAPVLHEARSLPAAFIQAGARAVLAASDFIPEVDAPRFFAGVRQRILDGALPAVALQKERQSWKAQGGERPWLDGVLLFE